MTPEVVEEEEEEEENENENAEEDEEDENAEEGDDEDTDVDTSPTVITQASTNITDQTTLEQWSQRFQAPEKTMQWCSQTPSYAAKVHGQSKVADQSRVHDATEAITSHTGSECRILSALTVKFRVLFKRDREMAM
ncbi:hypothetical protein EDD11_009284 [Mortierella claussenii]|nr:hypothetical protein EDD11_009284 [Mortierella claussenii]